LLPNFGLLACVIFFVSTAYLGYSTPGYDVVAQTISEIGSKGALFQLEFRLAMYVVCLLLAAFSFEVFRYAKHENISKAPAYVIFLFTIFEIGMFTYVSPHDLHNTFGSLSMVGWLLPIVVAISWRNLSVGRWFQPICYVLFIVNLTTIYWMLSPIGVDENNELAGIAQRVCFLALYISFSFVGMVVYRGRNSA
jgi:hypothetical protein